MLGGTIAKGYQANRERQEMIASFGKAIGKRAGFKCEWCEGTDNLQTWDYRPEAEPAEEALTLLCGRCRELADGKKGNENELRPIRNTLWSNIPAVAEGAARAFARLKAPWVREEIAESWISEAVKRELLK